MLKPQKPSTLDCLETVLVCQSCQETRQQLFNDYVGSGEDFAAVEAKFKLRLEESQKTSVKYGFRNDQWLIRHHGEKKAERIMTRKRSLGLNLGYLLVF